VVVGLAVRRAHRARDAVVSLAVGLVPFHPERVVALRRIGDVVFKRPVRLGDTVHVRGTVAGLADVSPEAGLVAFAWSVVNQRGQTVCRARVEVLWSRAGADAAGAALEANEGGGVPAPALT
jgi:acyl dehydratase